MSGTPAPVTFVDVETTDGDAAGRLGTYVPVGLEEESPQRLSSRMPFRSTIYDRCFVVASVPNINPSDVIRFRVNDRYAGEYQRLTHYEDRQIRVMLNT